MPKYPAPPPTTPRRARRRRPAPRRTKARILTDKGGIRARAEAAFQEKIRACATDAFARGRAAAASGETADMLRWLDRAHRLVPADDMVTLTLATVLIGIDDGRAAELFAALIDKGHDRAAIWLGIAAARLRSGDAAGAASAIARRLARHAVDADAPTEAALRSLAAATAAATDAPGWCGVTANLSPVVVPLHAAAGPVRILFDGQPIPDSSRRRTAVARARRLDVTAADGRALLGSPIDLTAIRAVEGFLEVTTRGGLAGWAWRPAAPEHAPTLTLRVRAGGTFHERTIRPGKTDATGLADIGLLMQPRRFAVRPASLSAAGLTGPITVVGDDGRPLLGSPLNPALRLIPSPITPRLSPVRRSARTRRRAPGIDIIIPVHDGGAVVHDCLATVLDTVPRTARIVIVDDASRDPAIVAAIDRAATRPHVTLIRASRNRGFVLSANAGLRAARAEGRDAILLNSDTLVPANWVERLRDALRAGDAASRIGTASPLSNDATILSYPNRDGANAVPDAETTRRIDAMAARVNAGVVVDVPTTVGFCMAIHADCLAETGLFRDDVFAQGYGEENDFCLRASALGWRHVAVPGVFVAHRGGASFGPGRRHLMRRNLNILERLHPGYGALIEAHVAADPLQPARRRIDARRLSAARPRGADAVLLVSHDSGGGTERVVAARAAAAVARGKRALVLRPIVNERDNGPVPIGARVADFADEAATPNLRFALPDELPALLRLLRAERTARVEFHQLLGHHPSLLDVPARLGVPYSLMAHDYALFCPRVTLVGTSGRYCGEPDLADCETCVDTLGSLLDEKIGVAALRTRSATLLAGATRVFTPSSDAATRLARHFPGIVPSVASPQSEPARVPPRPRRAGLNGRVRCGIVGAIGVIKGYDLLLGAAQDAAARDLPLDFVLVGHTADDQPLVDTGRVFITGPFRRADEAVRLLHAEAATIGLLPSVWPETWCFALTELWQAGLDVVCLDIGAQADRVRARATRYGGAGRVVPVGITPRRLNDALLAVERQTGNECPRLPADRAVRPRAS